MESAKQYPGKHFIVSFPEDFPTDEILRFIIGNKIGGVILFANHCRDIDSLHGWLMELKSSSSNKLIVAVDQEGGRVQRFSSNFPNLEAPVYYGSNNRLNQYRNDLEHVCERLFEVGVNVNLVPTVDLLDEEEGHALNGRTFSSVCEEVNQYAKATIDIHHKQGLLCCGKHFPGLGRSKGDPHYLLSNSDLTEDEFFELELKPFINIINNDVDGIMVTHLLAPEAGEQAASVSETIISGWLKGKLGFGQAVFTDDLLMKGAAKIDSIECLPIRSFAAGADFLLFGKDFKQTQIGWNNFMAGWSDEIFSSQRMDDALSRVNGFFDKLQG